MPIDPLSALADQLVQSLAKVLWNRPELSPLRERVQEVLKTRQFRTLTVQAFEEFERHLAGQLPDYFDEGFIRMPSVQTLLAQHIIDAVPVDIAALAQLYGKRHLRPSEAAEVQPLLDGYLLQLRDTFYHHPEYGQMLHIRDGRRMLEALDRLESGLAALGDAVTGTRRPPPGAKPRVFISYARKDGGVFAADLREKLLDAGIPLWQDRVGMEGGRDWWQQITEALDTVEFMVLVMTPHALQSEIIRREWRYARLQGVCVYPVKGVPDSQLDYASLPRWMRDVHWYDLEYEWPKFLNDLNTRCEAPRVPFMVEDLPEVFVPRPDEFENIISRLLDETQEEPVAITAALRGAGGFGKTTLARAICHDERVQQAFDDGILWVTLGEDVSASALMGKVRDLIETLSGERPGFEGLEAAVARLVELLAERDLLIVIDDVWKASDLRPFMQGGARCARLITTRDEAVLPRSAQKIIVESMAANEAIELLSQGLEPTAEDHERMRKLAAQLGEWALMLKLTNGILHERVARGQTLSEALTYVHRVLEKRGIFGLNIQANTDDRREVAAATLGLSLELLTEDERDRLAELAIFAEDIHIPLVTISRLWGAAVGWDDLDTEDLCTRLFDLSLLLDFSLTERYIRLHDVIRHYLIAQASERLSELHGRFLDSYPIARWRDLPEDEPYLWDWLAHHLIAADRGGELVETVRDVHFLARKMFYRQVYAVESDLNSALPYAPDDEPLRHLTRLVTNAGHVLNHCAAVEDTLETLVYRLEADGSLNSLIPPGSSLRTPRLAPYIPLQDRFHPALRRTLAGHSSWVEAVAISHHDRFIVSASGDGTLRVWDAAAGQLTHTFTGHSDRVGAVAISHHDRFIVSASGDGTLRVWDAAAGQLIHTLTGHSGRVVAVAISHHDRFIVSASWDHTLRIWDAAAGQLIHTLTGHSGSVAAVAISHDDRFIVSASWDHTLRVWDAAAGQLTHILTGHSRWVEAVALSHHDHFIVSASHDHTLRVWDAAAGQLIHTLTGHSDGVRAVAISHNDRFIVSASWDHTLRVWDAASGQPTHTLTGHSDGVGAVAISHDDRFIVSASYDGILRVWDAASGQPTHTLAGHSREVEAVAISHDDRFIVSASEDYTLRVWDAAAGQLIHTLTGHSSIVEAVALSHNDRFIVSASWDRTLRIWDAAAGQLIHTLTGHSSIVEAVAISHDDRFIVSASWDHILRVWDAASGQPTHILTGHSREVAAVALSHDDRFIVSASADHTLRVWDAASGSCLGVFYNEERLTACAWAYGGYRLFAGDVGGMVLFLELLV